LVCQHWLHQLVGRSLCLVWFGGCRLGLAARSTWRCNRLLNSAPSVLCCHHSIATRWTIRIWH
jgi:hypothetical protein